MAESWWWVGLFVIRAPHASSVPPRTRSGWRRWGSRATAELLAPQQCSAALLVAFVLLILGEGIENAGATNYCGGSYCQAGEACCTGFFCCEFSCCGGDCCENCCGSDCYTATSQKCCSVGAARWVCPINRLCGSTSGSCLVPPSPTRTRTATSTRTKTVTRTKTRSPTPSNTATPSITSSPSSSESLYSSRSPTPTNTRTSSITPSVSPSSTTSSSVSASTSRTPSQSPSRSLSASVSLSLTNTPSNSITSSITLSWRPRVSVSSSPKEPVKTPTPTPTPPTQHPTPTRRGSTPTPTRTPFHGDDVSSCFKSPRCSQDTDVVPSETQVKDPSEDLVIPIYSDSFKDRRVLIGKLTIPAGTLPKGCIVNVRKGELPKKQKKDECGHVERELASALVEVTLSGQCPGIDKDKPKFSRSLLVDLLGSLDGTSPCVGFHNAKDTKSEDEDWSCMSFDRKDVEDSLGFYQSKPDHLTTFAALLTTEQRCTNWIWITSLALMGSSLTLCFITVFLHLYSAPFRAWIAGYKGSSLEDVLSRVEDVKSSQS